MFNTPDRATRITAINSCISRLGLLGTDPSAGAALVRHRFVVSAKPVVTFRKLSAFIFRVTLADNAPMLCPSDAQKLEIALSSYGGLAQRVIVKLNESFLLGRQTVDITFVNKPAR
jgi:hypothetical protein